MAKISGTGLHIPYRIGSQEALRLDSLESSCDSISVDSMANPHKGIVLTQEAFPTPKPVKSHNTQQSELSWILLCVIALFCIIGIRFKNNRRYLKTLLNDLVDMRTRHNVFDDTVRETFLLVLLNALWCVAAGIIIYASIPFLSGSEISICSPTLGCALCTAVTAIYTIAMLVAYYAVGNVFSDVAHTRIWIKGFTASQGLCGIVFAPISLLSLFYPTWLQALLITALVIFIAFKIIFLWKGFRIFFTKMWSWILFLYYLCSLEIIPIMLAYMAAATLCVNHLL